MKGKLLYGFACPIAKALGKDVKSCKVGITGNPEPRLGVYQNSFSRNSHVAGFDLVYYGPSGVVDKLEIAIKTEYNMAIERDGWGASEWIDGYNLSEIEQRIDDIIRSCHYKVVKVSPEFLPLTTENLEEFLVHHNIK